MDDTKRQVLPAQVLPPGLWVVATPIGNLEDLSSRAMQALHEASVILCEDTRRTSQLLVAKGITSHEQKLVRLDAHASAAQIEKWSERMLEGHSFALVTDAGTPGISDPGAGMVQAARQKGILITPIPGPSAVMTLLSVAGFNETSFCFRGFFPRKNADAQDELTRAVESEIAEIFVWFESPQRITDTLQIIGEFDAQAQVFAAKELTKLYEKFFSGTAVDVMTQVAQEIEREGARGEWCFAVTFAKKVAKSSDWVKALHCLLDARVPASEAVRQVVAHFDVSRKTVYELSLELLNKKTS